MSINDIFDGFEPFICTQYVRFIILSIIIYHSYFERRRLYRNAP